MHVLIIGTTLSGKTTLARKLAQKAHNAGRGVLVLDPLLDPEWKNCGADLITDNPQQFLHLAKNNKNCTLFIDEAGDSCSQHDKEMYWLATQARHWGHQSVFIAQRATLIARSIRDNCSKLFLFCVTFEDAKLLYNDFCFKELQEAHQLKQGEFIYAPRFGQALRLNVFKNNA